MPGSSLVKASCRRRVFLSSGTKFPSHKACLVSHWMDLCFHDSALSSLSVFHSVVVAALFARTLPFFLFFSGSQSASLLPRPTLKYILVSLCEEFKRDLLAICWLSNRVLCIFARGCLTAEQVSSPSVDHLLMTLTPPAVTRQW